MNRRFRYLFRRMCEEALSELEMWSVDRDYARDQGALWSTTWSGTNQLQYGLSLPTYGGDGLILGNPALKQHFRTVYTDKEVRLTPEFSHSEIDLSVVDVGYCDRYELELEFRDTEGEIIDSTTLKRPHGTFSNDRKDEFSFDTPEGVDEIFVQVHSINNENKLSQLISKHRNQWLNEPGPYLSHPAVRRKNGTPIFIFSIDTFRYDYLDAFDPVLDSLDGDAIVPEEPRTQGHWTRPAHASLFTGVHPADHGYVQGNHEGEILTMSPSLNTLPEVLSEHGYKNSSCVVREKLGPKYGFGKGFHRGSYHPMSWDDREFDVSDIMNTLSKWVSADTRGDSTALFYFTHIFDAHFPYIPPSHWLSDHSLDFDLPDRYKDLIQTQDYLEILDHGHGDFPDSDLEQLKEYYRSSLEYVASELASFIQNLKHVGLFDQSLLIFLGDHGEDFLERNFMMHNSLTDNNIRPGAIIKPPKDADLEPPKQVDHIDIFPTICELANIPIPDQCQGQSWQSHQPAPRITERLWTDYYNIAVESDGHKAVFTYDQNFPNRPGTEVIERGPEYVETYAIEEVRNGCREKRTQIQKSTQRELQNIAKEFILQQGRGTSNTNVVSVDDKLEQQLEDLGYK